MYMRMGRGKEEAGSSTLTLSPNLQLSVFENEITLGPELEPAAGIVTRVVPMPVLRQGRSKGDSDMSVVNGIP